MTRPIAGEAVATRLRIHGRVQGVWFRGWTVDVATALGLRGWVRNRRDGTVEALLIGPAAAVEEMVRRVPRGPVLRPQVTRVDRAGGNRRRFPRLHAAADRVAAPYTLVILGLVPRTHPAARASTATADRGSSGPPLGSIV